MGYPVNSYILKNMAVGNISDRAAQSCYKRNNLILSAEFLFILWCDSVVSLDPLHTPLGDSLKVSPRKGLVSMNDK